MKREKLKGVKPKEPEENYIPLTTWTCGDDVPITWEPAELRKLNKKTLRQNYKSGCLTKEQYKARLKELRRNEK